MNTTTLAAQLTLSRQEALCRGRRSVAVPRERTAPAPSSVHQDSSRRDPSRASAPHTDDAAGARLRRHLLRDALRVCKEGSESGQQA